MIDVADIERELVAAVDRAREREAAIWRELCEMFRRQEARAEAEQLTRADEDAREDQLRAELAALRDDDSGDLSWD